MDLIFFYLLNDVKIVRAGMGGKISKFQGFYNMDKICIFPYPFAATTALGPCARPHFAEHLLALLQPVPLLQYPQGRHPTCLQQREPRGRQVANVCVFCVELLLLFPSFPVQLPP